MTQVTIFGDGNMGTAIAGILTAGGATVDHITTADHDATVSGEIVVLAVPYPALQQIATAYGSQLDGKVVVDGVNVAARHRKPTQANPQGGIDRSPAPMAISKVAIADPKDGKPTRVRFETRDGKKVRVAVKTGKKIDG